MKKSYEELETTKQQVIKLIEGRYSKKLFEFFEKSSEWDGYFEGEWPIKIVKSTYHLLTKTLVYEPFLTKRFNSYVSSVNLLSDESVNKWIKSIYPNIRITTVNIEDKVDYPFLATFFTSDDKESNLLYAEPAYVIIRTYISTPKIFRVETRGSIGEQGAYFYQSLNSGTIACTVCDYRIETDDDGENWHNTETNEDVKDEAEQLSVSKGICPKCGGNLIYYPTFE